MKLSYNTNLTLPKQSKDLDPSYKTDLDIWDCFGRKKTLSYNRRNRVIPMYNAFTEHHKALGNETMASRFFPNYI